jgi:hypothetical protein
MARRIPLALTLLGCAVTVAVGRPAPAPENPPLVVIDSAGKEQNLKAWKFSGGIRHLSWLAPAPASGSADAEGNSPRSRSRASPPVGPEALEFREENSTQLVEGVLTFVLLDRLRSIDYDPDQKTVTARIAAGKKSDDNEVLTGTTRFERVNKLAIDCEVDKGDLGVAEVRYLGGTARGIRGLRFQAPKPVEYHAGRPAVVTTRGKNSSELKVDDLQALYRFANGYERVVPLLMFKKTLKVDVSKVKKFTAAGADDDELTWQVQLKDGGDETLTLLRVIQLDGRDAQLEGLLGRVPAGFKLFPMLTISEITFDATEAKPEDKPETKPDKTESKPEK